MGGSGGGGGGGRIPPTITVTCIDLRFNVNLSSPNAAALANLRVNMLLEIELNQSKTGCVAVTETQVVGSIIHANLQQLISCIKSGNIYCAQVKVIDGAKCSVLVLHESRV